MRNLLVDSLKLSAIALVLYLLMTGASSAPVPRPREKKPRESISGSYNAYWSGSLWPTVLLPDGGYVAERSGGPRYEGRWSLDGDTFKVEERLVSPCGYGQVYSYTFTLRKGGLSSTCGGLRLERVR